MINFIFLLYIEFLYKNKHIEFLYKNKHIEYLYKNKYFFLHMIYI
jgi:hypothetical protein